MSLTSLGGYAIRNYNSISKENTAIILDLIDNCVSSFIAPIEHKSNIGGWKAREIIKMKGLYVLSTIPGALNMYWKIFKLSLIDIIPQLLPQTYISPSFIWNQSHQQSNRGLNLKDIDNVLKIIYQLSDGGCELSDIKSISTLNDDKKKKKDKEKDKDKEKEKELISLNEDVISNILQKLECLCEVIYYHSL